MNLTFKPNGSLNVSTAASDLTESKGSILTSDTGALKAEQMTRCKNLRLDQKGMARTRLGSVVLNGSEIGIVSRIVEQNSHRYEFTGSQIYEDEASIKTGLTGTGWSAILYNAFNSTKQNVLALNGTDRIRIEESAVYEWGIDAPTVAPTITTGAKTGLTGEYNACYTYCRKEGSVVVCESNPSDEAAAVVDLNNGSLSITWTASGDSQVTHVRIYRTLMDGLIYYHDQDVAVGTVTVDSNTADGSLGSEVASDHNRPPLGSFVTGPDYNGTCFIAKDNLLYYCSPKQPEYWPLTYYLEIGVPQHPVQCVVFYGNQPYALTKNSIYQIQGTAHDSFFPYNVYSITGAVNPNAACSRAGYGIYHVGTDGLYLYYSGKDTKFTQLTFDPIFKNESTGGMPAISTMDNCWLINYGNQLWFGYTSENHTYPSNVIVFNIDTERATYYSFPFEIQTICHGQQTNHLLAGCNDGFVRRLEVGDNDDDNEISWELQSKDFILQSRSHFPRWNKYDVDASDSNCTVTGSIILDDVVHQNHTLTGSNRNLKKRLVKEGNGKRLAFRITGTGTATVYSIEGE